MEQTCPYCDSNKISRVVGEAYSIKNIMKYVFYTSSMSLGYAQIARLFQCEVCRKNLWLVLVTSVKDCPAPIGSENVFGEFITVPFDDISKEDLVSERSLNREIH